MRQKYREIQASRDAALARALDAEEALERARERHVEQLEGAGALMDSLETSLHLVRCANRDLSEQVRKLEDPVRLRCLELAIPRGGSTAAILERAQAFYEHLNPPPPQIEMPEANVTVQGNRFVGLDT